MARPKITVLFTSSGRRLELMECFREAFALLNIEGKILVTDIDPLAPSLKEVDKFFLMPRNSHPDFLPKLVDICRREKVDLVLPLIDPDISILARNRTLLEETGCRVAVIDEKTSEVTEDKWLTFQYFTSLGIPVPRSWLPGEKMPEGVCYPVFIKPRNGSASQYTFKVLNDDQAQFFASYVPNPIFQEYLPGPEITTDVVSSLEGKPLGLVSRQRIEVRSGEVSKGFTVKNSQVTEACLVIARALPAVGPITIQCLLKDGLPFFTEINARLGGGIPLGIAAGLNVPKLLLESFLGKPHSAPITDYELDLYMTRCDRSQFFNRSRLAEMESHRI